MTKYKLSRIDWIARHLGDYNTMSHWDKCLADDLLAKASTKQGKKVKKIEKPPAYSATLDAWFGDVTEALNSLLKNK